MKAGRYSNPRSHPKKQITCLEGGPKRSRCAGVGQQARTKSLEAMPRQRDSLVVMRVLILRNKVEELELLQAISLSFLTLVSR